MNILLEQGGHAALNFGDQAMLEVAVKRFRSRFPGCSINVVARDAARLRAWRPDVTPIPITGRDQALRAGLLGKLSRCIGYPDRALIQRFPKALLPAALARQRLIGKQTDDLKTFVRTLLDADLVAASGGGYLTDSFPPMVAGVGGVLRLAAAMGKPTAMFSQGLGPLHHPAHRRQAAAALRGLRTLGVRENQQSPALAKQLGVEANRLWVTGDDAIELAHGHRPGRIGTKLGLNVRDADYAGIDPEARERLRHGTRGLLTQLGCEPQVLPISLADDDAKATAELIGAAPPTPDPMGWSPRDVITRTGSCRVVATGSYHAAVFALAQGIPAVGVAGSEYYRSKFDGLAQQFPGSCQAVRLDAPSFVADFTQAVNTFWSAAEDLRPAILRQAEAQIAASRSAYEHFFAQID